jgi:hypothetical protein
MKHNYGFETVMYFESLKTSRIAVANSETREAQQNRTVDDGTMELGVLLYKGNPNADSGKRIFGFRDREGERGSVAEGETETLRR